MEKPTSTTSTASPPPSPSARRTPPAIRALTVATSTELYDFLRLLFARAGRTYCPSCGQFVQRDTVDQVAQRMLLSPAGSRWYILFPIRFASDRPDALRDRLFELRQKGFNRLYQDGQIREFSTPESLLEIDFARPSSPSPTASSWRPTSTSASSIAWRSVTAKSARSSSSRPGADPPVRLEFSEKFACKTCHIEFPAPEPPLFSFNNPFGACPRCRVSATPSITT